MGKGANALNSVIRNLMCVGLYQIVEVIFDMINNALVVSFKRINEDQLQE